MSGKRSKPIEEGSILADRYELIKTLGEGGMGCVFMARHKQVGRSYAVKVLWTSREDDERMYRRFLQEAKIAGSFSHANLAAVYDYGETEDGYPFLVMDLVDGVSLQDMLIQQDKPLELKRAVNIFLQICAGLMYAHDKGLVHRDLKPANIMVVRNDGQEEVKIVDFGITKVLESFGESQQDLTKAGEIFGSPFYLSPEQCLGHPVDARSDIYSLGCLMYLTLSGRKPMEGNTTVETIVKHLHEPPPPFSETCPERKIPPQIEKIVCKCLEKEPEDRYQSLLAVAADLNSYLETDGAAGAQIGPAKEGTVGATASSGNKQDKPAGNFGLVATIAGAILVAGISFAVLAGKTGQDKQQAQSVAPPAISAQPSPMPEPAAQKPEDAAPAGQDKKEPAIIPVADQPPVPGETVEPTGSHGQEKPAAGKPDENKQKPVRAQETPVIAAVAGQSAKEPPKAQVKKSEARKAAAAEKSARELAEDSRKRIAHLQSDVVPKLIQEIDNVSSGNLQWDIDWSSFQNNSTALRAFEHHGLNEIRDALQEYALAHSPQKLKSAVKSIRIVNVSKIYERQVVLKSGALSIGGAWGEGLKGSPSALDIRLAIAGADKDEY